MAAADRLAKATPEGAAAYPLAAAPLSRMLADVSIMLGATHAQEAVSHVTTATVLLDEIMAGADGFC